MGVISKIWPMILALAAAFIGSYGQLVLKLGINKAVEMRLRLWKNGYFYVGIFLYAVATVVFVYALRFGKLTTLYPIIATSYIWTSLLASKHLGERMNSFKWAGILFIVAGVPFLAAR